MSHSSDLSDVNPVDLGACWGNSGLALNHLYIIWGGCTKRLPQFPLFPRDYSKLYVFNTHLKRWFCLQTSGECPKQGTPVIEGLLMYVVCSSVDDPQGPSIVNTLDLCTLKWSKLSPLDMKRPTPRDEFNSWIHDKKLYIFGGYGLLPHSSSTKWTNFEFLEDGGGDFVAFRNLGDHGRNNQLLCFDLLTNCWSSCEVSGDVPSVRVFNRTCLMGDTIVLFGGENGATKFNNIYTLNMKSLVWKRVDTNGSSPCGRAFHSLSTVSPCKLVMYKGYDTAEMPLSDLWFLDIVSCEWTQVQRVSVPRYWHSAVVIDNLLYVYAGREIRSLDHHPTDGSMIDLVELSIGVPSLHNLCHRVISSNYDLYPSAKLTAKLPKIESLRVLATRGAPIIANKYPLLELMRY